MKLYTGLKLFKFQEGKDAPDIIRVRDIYNDKKQIEYIDHNGNRKKMTFKEAKSYKILAPDGLLIFATANVHDDIDVIVTLTQFPKSDIKMKTSEGEPYMISRQLAVDPFSMMADSDNISYGVSISTETCPANMDFEWFFDFNTMGYKKNVAVYIDDTIDIILSLIDTEKFDNVLIALHDKYSSMFKGFCRSIKQLLEDNAFMYDFRRCFGIIELPFTIDDSVDYLSDLNAQYLGKNHLNATILETYIVRYSKEINTNEFKRDFVLVTSAEDGYDKVFIVGYDKA